jgi:uncharacterized protein (DUF305 family)
VKAITRSGAAALLGGLPLGLAACGGDEESAARPSGDAFDRAFIDAMVPHHESALEMARTAKRAGLSEPELVAVADDVLATQQEEIDRMKAWRSEWFGSAEIDPHGGAALRLTEEQMGMAHDSDSLLDSHDVDGAFAEMMIDHHEGAIEMAELAADNAGHDELKALAEAIVAAQEREVEIMRRHAGGAMDHG